MKMFFHNNEVFNDSVMFEESLVHRRYLRSPRPIYSPAQGRVGQTEGTVREVKRDL